MEHEKLTIKKMETEEEIRGKAFVHWSAWHEAYPGIVSEEYLEQLTLEKCEEMAGRWTDGILVAKEGDRVIGFVGFGDRARKRRNAGRSSRCTCFRSSAGPAWGSA